MPRYRAVSDYSGPHSKRHIRTGQFYDLDADEPVVLAGVVVLADDQTSTRETVTRLEAQDAEEIPVQPNPGPVAAPEPEPTEPSAGPARRRRGGAA